MDVREPTGHEGIRRVGGFLRAHPGGCGRDALHRPTSSAYGPVYSSVAGWNWYQPNQNDMCVGMRASRTDASAALTR